MILVRQETSPDDVHGMLVSKGILTSRGGTGSHAAVVARGLGLPAVVGCDALGVDYEQRLFRVRGTDRSSTRAMIFRLMALLARSTRARFPPWSPTLKKRKTCKNCWAGPTRSAAWVSGRTPIIPAMHPRGGVWRGGHWPVPHRAYVHGAGAPADCAADDSGS